MRQSLAWFSGPESSPQIRSLADFIATTSGFSFSVHTAVKSARVRREAAGYWGRAPRLHQRPYTRAGYRTTCYTGSALFFRYAMKPRPQKPRIIIAQVDGSG